MFYTSKPCILSSLTKDGTPVYWTGCGWDADRNHAAEFHGIDEAASVAERVREYGTAPTHVVEEYA